MNEMTIFEITSGGQPNLVAGMDVNWELLLGQILMNRVSSIAYKGLTKCNMRLPREFERNLLIHCEKDRQKAERFLEDLERVMVILRSADFEYSFLKGAYLSSELYELGERTSNDIDILINKKDLGRCKKLLEEEGFCQGSVDICGQIVPASRREVLFASLNYGETIPFLKWINDKVVEIDVNFSLNEGKSNDEEIVGKMLHRRKQMNTRRLDNKMWILCRVDFIIQLCCHLYKEACNITWVKYRRDLSLYKFLDVRKLLEEWANKQFCSELEDRIKRYQVQNECYFAFMVISEFWPGSWNKEAQELVKGIRQKDISDLKRVFDWENRAVYSYQKNFREWFLSENRMEQFEKRDEIDANMQF